VWFPVTAQVRIVGFIKPLSVESPVTRLIPTQARDLNQVLTAHSGRHQLGAAKRRHATPIEIPRRSSKPRRKTMKRIMLAVSALTMLAAANVTEANAGNKVIIEQYGFENGAAASQEGHRNKTVIHQKGKKNWARAIQRGVRNEAVIGQLGRRNAADIFQDGRGNLAGIAQFGSDHSATTEQTGSNNTSATIQVGRGQSAETYQSGNGNISVIIQGGY
jgi:hypothetical protein